MKQLLKSTGGLLFVMLMSMLMFSCAKEPLADSVIVLDKNELVVAADGGSYAFGYSIENPRKGEKLEVSSKMEWVKVTEVTGSMVSLEIEPNPSLDEPREATVNMAYANATATLKVMQQQGQASGEFSMSITVNSTSDVSVNATFVPSDNEVTYYTTSMSKADYGEGNDDEIIRSFIDQFKSMASDYGFTLQEYMESDILISGKQTRDFAGLKPETDYYVLAVGFTNFAEATTGIFKAEARTAESSGQSSVTFELSTESDNNVVTVRSVPSDDNARYVFSYIAAGYMEYLGVDNIRDAAQAIIDDELKYGTEAGDSIEEIVDYLSVFGPAEFTANFQPDIDYIIYAAAISEQGVIISEVSTLDYRFESEMSDNEFTIVVDEISVNTAHLTITTTNDDTYAIAIANTSTWEGLSDEEIAKAAISSGNITEWSGPYDNNITNLQANTSYVVIAFGYSSSAVTTSVAKHYFTTEMSGNASDLEFSFLVEDINVRGATITVTATPETALYFTYVKPAEMTESEIKSEYEAIIQNYLSIGMIASRVDYFLFAGVRGTDTYTYKKLSQDTEYRAFAIGINENDGTYATPMAFSEPFRTLKMQEVDIVVEVEVPHYFDCDELVKAGYEDYSGGAGKAVVDLRPVISGTDECAEYYYYIGTADLTDPSVYSDEYMIYDVLYSFGFHNEKVVHAYIPYDKVCTLVAIGLDKDGNVGKLYREKIQFDRDGVSDVEYFEPLRSRQNSRAVIGRE